MTPKEQHELGKAFAPVIARAIADALQPLLARIEALEREAAVQRVCASPADRVLLNATPLPGPRSTDRKIRR